MDFFNNFSDSDLLKKKLTKISIFIAVYEHFKFIIIQNLVSFFSYGDEYDKTVLNKISSKKIEKLEQDYFGIKIVGQ